MSIRIILAAGMLSIPGPLVAQDLGSAEIMVTASRIEQDDYSREMPAVGLRRSADFLVQQVTIRGDTRDQKERRREIRAMLANAVAEARKQGLELAYGDYILTALTAANIEELSLRGDSRPDSERVDFLVKVRLGGAVTGEAAEARIARFVETVPEVGRAQMDQIGDSSLSIVGPDSYRLQIAGAIAQDARAMAGAIGESYAVEIEGLNMPVQWTRAGPSEVLLYIPYKLVIVPRP